MSRLTLNKVSEEPEKEYLKSAKKILLGKKRPPLFTRIILGVALFAFIYYFFWHGLKMIAFAPGTLDFLDAAQQVKFDSNINKLGAYFGIAEPKETFLLHAQVMVVSWGVVMLGMLLIYRRKVTGYYIFYLGLFGALIAPFFILGWDYATTPSRGTDLIDHFVPPVLFIIFFISMRRLKRLKEEARKEAWSQL